MLDEEIDNAYIQAASSVSLSDARDTKVVYSPLHGTGYTNVTLVLELLGFEVHKDPKTSNPSGKFENVTFNIPNPEVEQSFETSLEYAREIDADILLNSDPDADRIGIMVKHDGDWVFLDGNQIAVIIAEYVITKRLSTLDKPGIIIKTDVTTGLIQVMCEHHGIDLIGDLLVGYKYV